MVVLIGVLVVAHVARVLAPAAVQDAILNDYALDPVVYSAKALAALGAATPSLFARLVPPFSYTFLHANFTHLAFNCLWLLVFGPVVARRYGAPAFLRLLLPVRPRGRGLLRRAGLGPEYRAIGASGCDLRADG